MSCHRSGELGSTLGILGLALTVGLMGCSLSTFEHDTCETDAQCQTAFGHGSVCNADGLCEAVSCNTNAQCRNTFGRGSVCNTNGRCEPVAIHPRCTETYPEDLLSQPAKHTNAIVFGTLMDRSAPKKVARQRSARLAALQANAERGLDDREFGLVMCTIEENSSFDDLSGTDAAVATANYLSDQLGLAAIIGPSGSGNTTAVFTSIQEHGTLIISPSATSSALSSLEQQNPSDENPGLLWRTAPPDSFQGSLIVSDAQNRGIQHMAVIHQVDAYGEGLANVINAEFTAGGGQVSLVPWESENERTEAIIQVSTSPASEVVFVASNSADNVAFLLAAASTAGYETKTFFLPDAAASQDVFDAAAAASGIFPRIRGTRPKPLGDQFAYKNFAASYQGEYGEDVKQYSYTAQTYDAAWLVFYGSAWSQFRSNTITGKGIGWGLRKVSCLTDGATTPCNSQPFDVIPSSWTSIVQQFRNGTAVDINGASGELNYDLTTEETTAPLEVWVVQPDGTIVPAPI